MYTVMNSVNCNITHMKSIKMYHPRKYSQHFTVDDLQFDAVYYCDNTSTHYILGEVSGERLLISFPDNKQCVYCSTAYDNNWVFVECETLMIIDEAHYKLIETTGEQDVT